MRKAWAMLLELVVDMENPFGRLKEKLIIITLSGIVAHFAG